MSFLSFAFLLFFLPVCALCRFLLWNKSEKLHGLLLLLASIVFIYLAQPKSLLAVGYTAAVCYFAAAFLDRHQKYRKLCYLSAVIFVVAPLFYLKYAAFFAGLFGVAVSAPDAPVGISFFTFLAVSYLTDVYRKSVKSERSPLSLALYFTAFPKFLQGPLTRYEAALPQKPSWDDCECGCERFVLGLGKKLLLASAFANAAKTLLDGGSISCAGAWLGSIFYALEIYFDFSGYTDMAIGIGKIFGLTLPENFDLPYLARSVTDFWRRWHITLSRWFRDYIYIPLGGNRKGLARQLLNLLIVWSLTGLWHGAGVNFVLWGLYYAVLLMLEKLALQKLFQKLPPIFGHLYALLAILIGWVLFRSSSFGQIANILGAMFGGSRVSFGMLWLVLRQYGIALVLGILISFGLGAKLLAWLDRSRFGQIVKLLGLLFIFALCILSRCHTGLTSFIYAQF